MTLQITPGKNYIYISMNYNKINNEKSQIARERWYFILIFNRN